MTTRIDPAAQAADLIREGFGVRAQTRSRSSAYRSRRQAIDEGKYARVVAWRDGWYTVYTLEAA